MITLVTSNPAKYAPFAADLERLRLTIQPPAQPLPELQSLNFIETLTAKAKAAAALFGRPVIVDDTGLVLEAYPSFPGTADRNCYPQPRHAGTSAIAGRNFQSRDHGMSSRLLVQWRVEKLVRRCSGPH